MYEDVRTITNFAASVMMLGFFANHMSHIGVTSVPKPTFFTHDVGYGREKELEEILSLGFIKPVEGSVSVSLDGGWGLAKGRSFMFDISKIYGLRRKPVIYVGTGIPMELHVFRDFIAYSVDCVFAMEVEILEPIPVSLGKLVEYTPKDTELLGFVYKITKHFQPIVQPVIEAQPEPGAEWPELIPKGDIAEVLHGYNKMVCELCGVDYQRALREVEGVLGEENWKKWW